MKEYVGDREFIELADKAIKLSEDELSRWAKVVIASHTMQDIKKPKDIVLCMAIGSGLLIGALTKFDLTQYNNIICICQACDFLGVTEEECRDTEDIKQIQEILRAYYLLHTGNNSITV